MKREIGVLTALALILQTLALPVWAAGPMEGQPAEDVDAAAQSLEMQAETAFFASADGAAEEGLAMRAGGEPLELPVLADAMVQKGTANNNFGATEVIFTAAKDGELSREIFLKFDLSQVQQRGAVILNAELFVTYGFNNTFTDGRNSREYQLFYVADDSWTEGDGNNTKPGSPTDITWNSSRDMAQNSVKIFDSGTERMNQSNTTPTVMDITEAVAREQDPYLSLRFVTSYPGTQTWGCHIFSKEADVDPMYQPHLSLTFTDDPDMVTAVNDARSIIIQNADGTDADLGAVKENLALPTVGNSGETEIYWVSDNPALIDNMGNVTRPAFMENDQEVTLTANVIKGAASYTKSFTVTVLEEKPTDEMKAEHDFEEHVKPFDGITAISDLELPFSGSFGSAIAWESGMPEYLGDDGSVTRPTDADVKVPVTVTVSNGEAVIERVITIIIPMVSDGNRGSLLSSLARVSAYAADYAGKMETGEAPGQVAAADRDKALLDMEAVAGAVTEQTTAGGIKLAIAEIGELVKRLVGTAVQSEAVIDEETNALEFSSYRIQLMQDVIDGEIAMMTEPEMYPASARFALQEYIDYAKSVLDGSYKRPFTHNRSFVTPRPDENIQMALKRYSKTYPGYNSSMGMADMNGWYASQHITSDILQTVQLSPSDDSYVQKAGEQPHGSEVSIASGNGRVALIKFDLSKIGGEISGAALQLYNSTNNNNQILLYQIPQEINAQWDEKTVTQDKWLAMNNATSIYCLGDTQPLLAQFGAGGNGTRSTISVTDQVIAQQNADGSVGFAIWDILNPAPRYPCGFHSKEAANASMRPVLEVKINEVERSRLEALYQKAVTSADEMLSAGEIGEGVGQYPADSYDALALARADAERVYAGGDIVLTGKMIVKLYDAIWNMHNTQVLRQDIEPLSNTFFTEEDVIEFSNKINKYSVLQDQYNYLKKMSDEMDLTQVERLFWIMNEDHSREEINQYFKLWSSVPPTNFTVPGDAAYATLEIYLPSEEHENQENPKKVGHIWIDDVSITGGDEPIVLENDGFETGTDRPEHWEYVTYRGNPKFAWEARGNYVYAGSRSVYIQNPTAEDQGGIRYTGRIPLAAGQKYSISIRNKIDEKLNCGVVPVITYYNSADEEIGTFTTNWNNKSNQGNLLAQAQADAIVYAVEHDIYYAQKAKNRLLFSVNDFCQGAEHWQINNSRPDGIDAYGEVQGGRIMQSICTAYTLIKDAGVFTPEEYTQFIAAVEYLAQFLLDSRDRTTADPEDIVVGGNWLTDQSCGAAMYGVTFPDRKNARQFLMNGSAVLYEQLKRTVYADGGWPESIRYAGGVIQKFAPFARVINIARGDDWWGTTNLPKMFDYAIHTSTPPYSYFNNQIGTPPFGDADLRGSSSIFAYCGQYYDQVAKVDIALAQQMQRIWQLSGSPMSGYGGEVVALMNFFNPMAFDFGDANHPLALGDYQSPTTGVYIFRENYGRENAKYFFTMSNDTEIGHGHKDQGSFILYANSVPLVMDPGVESYFTASKTWYTNSSSHAALLFTNDGVTPDTGPATSRRDSIFHSDEMDYIRVSTTWNRTGNATDHRNYALLENGFNAVIIWDMLRDAPNTTIFNMPVVAKSAAVNGNVVTSKGFFGTDLKTTVLEPANAQITTGFKPTTPVAPKVNGENVMNYIMSYAPKEFNHLVVLEPLKSGQKSLSISELDCSSPGITAYRLTKVDGTYAVVIANNADYTKKVTINANKDLIDMQTGERYASANGKATVSAQGGRLTLLKSEDVKAPAPMSVEITGNSLLKIPTAGVSYEKFGAHVVSQYNNTLPEETVTWGLKEAVPGVSVDSQSGTVTVLPNAKNGAEVTITASNGQAVSSKTVRLSAVDSQRSDLVIHGPEVVSKNEDGAQTVVVYEGQVLDQFGSPMEDRIVWSLYQPVDGVSLDSGVLTVGADVPIGTAITLVAKSASSVAAVSSKTVRVASRAAAAIQLDGMRYVCPPETGERTYLYRAKIVDQNNQVFGEQAVTFALADADDRMDMTEDGVLTVRAGIPENTEIRIRVTAKSNPALYRDFSVFTAFNVPSQITVSGKTAVTAPGMGGSTFAYTAEVLDENGNAMSAPVTYRMKGAPAGVILDSDSGTLTVHATAVSAKFTVTAAVVGFEEQLYDSIEVTLTSKVSQGVPGKPSGGSGGGGGGFGGGTNSGSSGGTVDRQPGSAPAFADVSAGHWAHTYIEALAALAIVNGGGDGYFYPEQSVTRAQFAQMLWKTMRLEPGGGAVFPDVDAGAWYYDAVTSLAASGLLTGYEDGAFRPDATITREEMAVILHRALTLTGAELPQKATVTFTDESEIAAYAANAVQQVAALGLLTGFPDGTYGPKQNAARAEVTAVLYRSLHMLRRE